jgi:hypothetical protein
MPITVEDGTGMAGADAYVAIADVVAYAASRGLAFPEPLQDREQAIVRATAYLDARYGGAFTGQRLRLREQALAWPRSGAVDAEGVAIAIATVPREIKAATCEAAIRERGTPGGLAPDLERGGAIKSLQAGSVQIVYADGATPLTVMQAIDNALAGIIPPNRPGTLQFAKVTRA